MLRAVLDTTILVSALLKPAEEGPSYSVLRLARDGAYEAYLSDDILEETAQVLLTSKRIRQRYSISPRDVIEYCESLAQLATIVSDIPEIRVVRDPNDDMILGCAIAAHADVLVTRDKDLLTLETYEGIAILAPEDFLRLLRERD
jgi:putative PIN family toxin of toxin-antitoxin system